MNTNYVVFDLETIPTQNEEMKEQIYKEVEANFSIPKTITNKTMGLEMGRSIDEIDCIKKDDMMSLYYPFKLELEQEAAYRKTSFDGGLGEIVSIAWASNESEIPDSSTRDITTNQVREIDILDVFNNAMASQRCDGFRHKEIYFVGHNIAGFDLAFLWKRFVIHGIEPTFNIKINGYHERDFYDTMLGWNGKRYGNKDKKNLDFLGNTLGIGGKDGMDGSKVWDAAKNGQWEDIAKYCRDDVAITNKLYKRLHFRG